MNRAITSLRRARGLSMIELLVALAIGGVIIAGAVYVYDQSRNTYNTNDNLARIQEQARFTLSLVETELQLAGYYGFVNNTNGMQWQSATTSDGIIPAIRQEAAVKADYVDAAHACGRNFAVDIYTPVQGSNDEFLLGPGATTDCDPQGGGYLAGTDTITTRRAGTNSVAALDVNKLQIIASRMGGAANFLTAGKSTPNGTLMAGMYEIRDLVVRTFYISQDSEGFPGVPALRMKSLRDLDDAGGAFADDELASGVEDLQIQFGVDTASYDGDDDPDFPVGGNDIPDGNGQATRYVDPDHELVDPTNENAAQIVSVRIWLRVRGDAPERGFTDDRTYTYAGKSYTPSADEAVFRRMLVSRTIQLRNARTL
jgi:type IV pilus assembly protein PilW